MTNDLIEHNETHKERLLRASLREHAPAEIDTENAWAAVAGRLSDSRTVAPAALAGRSRRRWTALPALVRTQRPALMAATLIVMALLLGGAGVGAAYWGGLFGGDKAALIGDERLYTTINQSQTVGDVTITIDKVYADPGNTYIAVLIRAPKSTARQYSHAILNHFRLTDANGQDAVGGNLICDPMPHNGSAEHCLVDYGPVQPNADGTHVTLTVDIGEVWLLSPNAHDPDVRTGPWHFTFTLPFHQQSLGSGGPYTQPGPGH